ncbi:MAG TPA: cellulase N-terminal Ig-like domain-containing protein, partial [Phnomibacter sp.]|nr:cellulase N-terminal Ig-like domain-containing protein [Phnomibacter sp.]
MKKTFRFGLIMIFLLTTTGYMKTGFNRKKVVLFNQVGYICHAPKMLLVSPDVNQVRFLNELGSEILQVIPSAAEYWEPSGDSVRKVNFSSITLPGKYKLFADGEYLNVEVSVAEKPYHDLSVCVMKSFYLQRMGMPIAEEYAGKWARAAGHPDTAVVIHPSAA